MKNYTYGLQVFGIRIFEKIILLMNFKVACFIFGILSIIFSPFIPRTYLAYKNITLALNKKNIFEKIKIIIGMWNNLGRIIVEFIWFNSGRIDVRKYIEIDEKSMKILSKIKSSKDGDVVFSLHFSNFEVFAHVSKILDLPKFYDIYRPIKNKCFDEFITKYRNKTNGERISFISKKNGGTRTLIKYLKSGGKALLFVDQRFDNDITVPFFGIPSKTSSTPSTFAIKYNCNLYSGVIIRQGFFSSKFSVKVDELKIKKTGDDKKDIYKTTLRINKFFEKCIEEYPEQWFSWMHNRWKNN